MTTRSRARLLVQRRLYPGRASCVGRWTGEPQPTVSCSEHFLINSMHRADVDGRNHYPLGDEAWPGSLLRAG